MPKPCAPRTGPVTPTSAARSRGITPTPTVRPRNTPLAEVIAGLRETTGGRVLKGGQVIDGWSPARRTESGLAYIPEERMHDGVIQEAARAVVREAQRAPIARGRAGG